MKAYINLVLLIVGVLMILIGPFIVGWEEFLLMKKYAFLFVVKNWWVYLLGLACIAVGIGLNGD